MTCVRMSLIILTVVALSTGQILFKFASSDFSQTSGNLFTSLLNTKVMIALIVYFFATVMWLFVLRTTPLRLAYPFVALAFFLVPIMAHFFLGERLSWNTFVGASFIAIGVWVSVYE